MCVRRSRVKAFLYGCKVMRGRYRGIVERMERGWRERFRKHRLKCDKELEKDRERLRLIMQRFSSITPEAYGHGEFGMVVRLDSRMLHAFNARDDERVIEHWAREVAYAFEKEVRQLNFAKLGELECERQREQGREPRWGYGRDVPRCPQ